MAATQKKFKTLTNRTLSKFLLFFFIAMPVISYADNPVNIVLEKNNFRIILSEKEQGPVQVAVKALQKDFLKVMDFSPEVSGRMDKEFKGISIIIVNRALKGGNISGYKKREMDGFESHRVYADPDNRRIYLEGYDMRGTIYAIYTFSEKVLGVPPLHYWCNWNPAKVTAVSMSSDTDLYFKSPQVRYRAIFPNDTDFFSPWRKVSGEHDNIWLETVLRLKFNTVELSSTVRPGYRMSEDAYLVNNYGLVLTSHHTNGLNTSFSTWEAYWKEVRKTEPPELLLSNDKEILEFFRYNAETVNKSGIENLWTLAFRGSGDQPFWSVFKDAPKDDKERATVINRMLGIQLDIIKEVTGNPDPYVRMTFYDEIADLMANNYLKPPVSRNMIWTYVAARRDHYPYNDIVNFDTTKPVKLGYYMNFQFTSTGAHVTPAEGPWKMEFNYRFVNSKSPLYFSVVNAGNFREFVLELSANAKMLWDYNNYNSDQFMAEYSEQYFGKKYSEEIAQLYKDYFSSFWVQKKSEFPGLDRQFIFQDLRYVRAFDHIYGNFFGSDKTLNLNPLKEIGYERTPGRTFRIDPEFNNAHNQVDAMLNGIRLAIPKFEAVAARSSEIMLKLDQDKQTFFNDNLRVYSYYMTHLNKALYHFLVAYQEQAARHLLVRNLELSGFEAVRAQQYIFETRHGVFSTWYDNAVPLEKLTKSLTLLREEAIKRN